MSLNNTSQKYLNLAVWSSIVWLEIFFLISTKVCDTVTKNDYIITSFPDWFTVGLSSRYNFLSFRYILILGLLFGSLSYCSAFTVSFTSSSTNSYSNLSGESIFSFYWLNWMIVLTRLLFFDFWKKSILRFQHLHFGKYFGYGRLIEEFFIVGELLIWETLSSNAFMFLWCNVLKRFLPEEILHPCPGACHIDHLHYFLEQFWDVLMTY